MSEWQLLWFSTQTLNDGFVSSCRHSQHAEIEYLARYASLFLIEPEAPFFIPPLPFRSSHFGIQVKPSQSRLSVNSGKKVPCGPSGWSSK
jgi:hypothetical protein